jgi:predicted RNase H-like nuclease (RuvC/YqgF family)
VWAIEDGVLMHFVEGYDAYRAWLEDRGPRGKPAEKTMRREAYQSEKRASRQEERDRRRQRERHESLEAEIARLEARLVDLQRELEAASRRQRVEAVARLAEEYGDAQRSLEAKTDEWLALEGDSD